MRLLLFFYPDHLAILLLFFCGAYRAARDPVNLDRFEGFKRSRKDSRRRKV